MFKWQSMELSISINVLINFSQEDKLDIRNYKRQHYENHIDDLKYKILRDRTYEVQDYNKLPPYLRKRNRRFKSIYETMHERDHAKKSKPSYGHLEYQQFIQKNEIPDADLLTELLQNSFKKAHHKKHNNHHSRSHHKIKKLRSSKLPEVGIMQKKLKAERVLGERRS